ncbi:MAG: GxxExxY protein [Planctomycetota bacterium]
MSDGLAITDQIIQGIIGVHQALGPGFVERVYHNSLIIELESRGLKLETEHEIVVYYQGKPVGKHRLDLLVEGRVIVELKCVEALSKSHYAQIRSYLRATDLRTGILVNFATDKADFRRVENRTPSGPSP